MATLDIILYIIIFGITVLFSLIAIDHPKEEVHYKFIAGLCWIVFTMVHFIITLSVGALAYAITILWLGFGLTFIVMGIQEFFSMKKDKIWGFKE
jgi:hypothetical protein